MKKPRHRVFDYSPRHYDPLTDEKEKKKRRLGLSRQRKFKSRRQSPIILFAIIGLVIYIILKLTGQV
ncbi:hypothetical protein ACFLSS_01770 [Bacteroidota bacterium]